MADPTQHIRFRNEEEKQDYTEALLGEEVKDFLNSTTGQYLHGRAKIEYDQCVHDMFELDPYSPEGKKKYEKLRRTAWCAERFMQWCADAINNGMMAEARLNDQTDTGE